MGVNGQATGATLPTALPKPKKKPAAAEPKDSFREIVETVVFVVVLVLLLKAFVAEAFVIPTGSMATTLWGYQKVVDCPRCGFSFPLNASDEEPEGRRPKIPVVGGICPNCRYEINLPNNINAHDPGDRVLVGKYLYDTGATKPRRGDVVVFKYPMEPQRDHVAMNYIKRLIGLPGETIGIRYGKIYVLSADRSPKFDDSGIPPEDLWHQKYMHENEALDLFNQKESPFEIFRKPPKQVLAMRRIVYDNDHPANDLTDTPRWVPAESPSAWTPDEEQGFHRTASASDQIDWLRYRNVLRGGGPEPQLITDFLGYNSKKLADSYFPTLPRNWVGDLMLEAEVTVEQPQGELVLELSKGVDRFRARWDLASDNGLCTLTRLTNGKEEELDRQPTALKGTGTHAVRFANVDERLLVWVDDKLVFGDGCRYAAPEKRGPTRSDLQPASIGVRGASMKVHHLKLWRDTYYTQVPGNNPSDADVTRAQPPITLSAEERDRWDEARRKLDSNEGWGDPSQWEPLRDLPSETFYVQPGHFLCLGDNSPESSDGRSWGLVPARLLLGRALLVYYPIGRAGPIR
jgi:signal peptidase I